MEELRGEQGLRLLVGQVRGSNRRGWRRPASGFLGKRFHPGGGFGSELAGLVLSAMLAQAHGTIEGYRAGQANMGPGRHPTASFFCPRFFCQPGIHGPGCEGKVGKKIEGNKMGGGMQQKETKATKQVHPLRSLCGLLFGLPSPDDRRLAVRQLTSASRR